MKTISLLPVLFAAAILTVPATGLCDGRNVTVQRDLDGDGHYNKKTYTVNGGRYPYYGGSGYYNRGYNGYGRPYYGARYYGPRFFGSGYCGPGYAPYYGGAAIGLTVYARPTPYYPQRVYRGRVAAYPGSVAVDVQRALQQRGYYRGAIDGAIGPQSRAAIRAYQRDRGLSANGRIDSALLRSLRVG
ncbi:MAG: peptidoglycan-binding protein [Chthoniobacteraceae bacterium]